MDGWAPLAPTKRFSQSGQYARAATTTPLKAVADVVRGAGAGPSSLAGRHSTEGTKAAAAGENGGADAFPPVGQLPHTVALHVLSFLPISDQGNCALAGRALARVVADEANWSRRLEALDWCHVDGLTVQLSDEDSSAEVRSLGRRRKGVGKEVGNAKARANAATPSSKAVRKGETKTPANKAGRQTAATLANNDDDDDDDFGDFAGPSSAAQTGNSLAADDGFGDFVVGKAPVGGSFASGFASVAIGGGQRHSMAIQKSASPTSSHPTTFPFHQGSKGAAAPGPAASGRNGALFSYAAEAALPLCSDSSPSFRKLRAYAKALRNFQKSLADLSGPPTSSFVFTCDLGLDAQAALLSNLLRYISTDVGGVSSAASAESWQRSRNKMLAYDEDASITIRGQSAARQLQQTILSSFQGALARRGDAIRAAAHGADTARAIRRAEDDMRGHACALWELGNARLALALSNSDCVGDDEGGNLLQVSSSNADQIEDRFGRMDAAKVFLETRDILTQTQSKHNPLDNIVSKSASSMAALNFTAMDGFMSDILDTVGKDGQIVAAVFPPEQDVLIAYADRVANDAVARYTRPLLDNCRSLSMHLYLRCCAATFAQAMRISDALLAIEPRDEDIVNQERCQDVVLRMWEANVDDYLKGEREWVIDEMGKVTEKWESDLANETAASQTDAAIFLNSQNPAAVKRSVLSGFKDVLLLPVTVVPRTVGYVGNAAIRTAGSGLSSLNPRRWQAGGASSGTASAAAVAKGGGSPSIGAPYSASSSSPLPSKPVTPSEKGYVDFSGGMASGGSVDVYGQEAADEDEPDDDLGDDFNEKDEWNAEVEAWGRVASARPSAPAAPSSVKRSSFQPGSHSSTTTTTASSSRPTSLTPSSVATRPSTISPIPSRSSTPLGGVGHSPRPMAQMQLLLSLDTALQVIHVNRDCIKRVETFTKYPDEIGARVSREIEEVAILFFHALGEGHVAPGFAKATKQIQEWKPRDVTGGTAGGGEKAEEDDEGNEQVEPLVHFFELVHVGDTIAQMVQVYFDQELSHHIDKNDFLNAVVREKKRFESNLDEAVAKGLNAGVDLLLGQAEHLIMTRQAPGDYYPDKNKDLELGPSRACREAVDCLRTHCKMLVGTTDKNVLEVFYQEVGIRLHAIICKHLKRQIISLDGGFKVIADLNHYHAFISTLRQSSITPYFDALKMLGNVYIIDSPKELAQIARDANMFGGTLSPEDLYEFLQVSGFCSHFQL